MTDASNEILNQLAIKFDGDKLRYDLIPHETLESLAKVLTFGAQKYEAHNWKKGFSYMRIYSSLMRHLISWLKGEDKDPETGFLHLEHALCNICFLAYYAKYKSYYEIIFDDRPSEP